MIAFTYTEEQDLFCKAARDFAETKIAPLVPKMEENDCAGAVGRHLRCHEGDRLPLGPFVI